MNTWLIAALWMGLALAAALGSVQFGISVALVEILLGFLAGNTFHLNTTLWMGFSAASTAEMHEILAEIRVVRQTKQVSELPNEPRLSPNRGQSDLKLTGEGSWRMVLRKDKIGIEDSGPFSC
jgi:hypothetical protein